MVCVGDCAHEALCKVCAYDLWLCFPYNSKVKFSYFSSLIVKYNICKTFENNKFGQFYCYMFY